MTGLKDSITQPHIAQRFWSRTILGTNNMILVEQQTDPALLMRTHQADCLLKTRPTRQT
jgi:hypothetical protein